MRQEKIFILETGRAIKVITEGLLADDLSKITVTSRVLIKDPREDDFHLPITETHPKYWKLKKLDQEQARLLHIRYSGVTDKQIRKAVKEFEQMLSPAVMH
jgi:geranylgeranyl pyrophosphate synthase